MGGKKVSGGRLGQTTRYIVLSLFSAVATTAAAVLLIGAALVASGVLVW